MKTRPRTALLALGSNLDPTRHVPQALALLATRFEVLDVSPAYRSVPFGTEEEQPDFVNLALRVRTDCPPLALREACRRIEEACGRRRTADRYAARTMDIDVALLDDLVLDLGMWRLPDPELHLRPFVLVPCADVWPDAEHPVLRRTLAELRDARVAENGGIALERLPRGWEASS